LASLGVAITNTAIIPLAVTGVYLLYRDKVNLKKWMLYLLGGLVGFSYWFYTQWFYNSHPSYNFYNTYSYKWSVSTLTGNLVWIWDMLEVSNFLKIGGITLFALMILVVLLIWKKNWSMLLVFATGALGTLALLGMPKVNQYASGVLISIWRMFLFMPYTMCLCWFIYGCNRNETIIWKKDKLYTSVILLGFFAVTLFKTGQIAYTLNETDELNDTSAELDVVNVQQTVKFCNDVLEAADSQENIEWIVSLDDLRPYVYIMAALGYDKYHIYNCHFERRTWEWEAACEEKEQINCLGFDVPDGNFQDSEVLPFIIENQSVAAFFESKGWTRQ
jgi:hypothetical protein